MIVTLLTEKTAIKTKSSGQWYRMHTFTTTMTNYKVECDRKTTKSRHTSENNENRKWWYEDVNSLILLYQRPIKN